MLARLIPLPLRAPAASQGSHTSAVSGAAARAALLQPTFWDELGLSPDDHPPLSTDSALCLLGPLVALWAQSGSDILATCQESGHRRYTPGPRATRLVCEVLFSEKEGCHLVYEQFVIATWS